MRLAQIARKVGLPPVEVKRFLESEFELTIGNEPNYKLNDDQIDAVLEKFPIPEPVIEIPVPKEEAETAPSDVDTVLEEAEQIVEAAEELKPIEAEKVADIETTAAEIVAENIEIDVPAAATEIQSIPDESEILPTTDDIEIQEAEANLTTPLSEVEINYDEPEEEQDSDAPFVEVAVNRDAELIKAPKVKLDGLKVLGKIELPGDKEPEVIEKTEEEIAQEEADAIADLDAAMQLNAQDIKPAKINQVKPKAIKEHLPEEESYSEFKDNRGIYHFSLQQKQNREKSLVRVELARKKEEEKEKKKRYYQETMKDRKQKETVVVVSKTKQKKIETRKQKREEKNVEAPKGLWGRFIRWLND